MRSQDSQTRLEKHALPAADKTRGAGDQHAAAFPEYAYELSAGARRGQPTRAPGGEIIAKSKHDDRRGRQRHQDAPEAVERRLQLGALTGPLQQ